MAATRLALLLVPALAFAALPTAQAQVFDPEPHDCEAIVLSVGVDSGCGFWACHSGCDAWSGGCPGHGDCEYVVCDHYVETPVLLACFHDDETAMVRCLTELRDLACLGRPPTGQGSHNSFRAVRAIPAGP